MNELKSYTEYAVSTPTADFVIGFDFNYGEGAVNVTVDNVPATEAGYTVVYLNETTIRLSPSVPSGVVRLQRETDIDQTDHAYRAGAKFIAQTMDENFTQLRHAQQEVRDGFVKLADDTYEIIDTLNEVGQSAQAAADAAEVAAQLANNAATQVNDKVSQAELDLALTPVNASLELAKRGIANRYDSSLTYNSGERVVLTNGDIVKSTIDGNTNDPNVDMTGWVSGGGSAALPFSTNIGTGSGNNYILFPEYNDIAPDVSASTISGGGNNLQRNMIGYTESVDVFLGDGSSKTFTTTYNTSSASDIDVWLVRADSVLINVTPFSILTYVGGKTQVLYPKDGHFVNDAGGTNEGTNPAVLPTQKIRLVRKTKNLILGSNSSYCGIYGGYDNLQIGIMNHQIGAHLRITGGNHQSQFGGSYNAIGSGAYHVQLGGSGNEISGASGTGVAQVGGGALTNTGANSWAIGGYKTLVSGARGGSLGATNSTNSGSDASIGGQSINNSGAGSFVYGQNLTNSGSWVGQFGFSNTNTGNYSIQWGRDNSNTKDYSVTGGRYAVGRTAGARTYANGRIAANGDAQTSTIQLKAQTTSVTAVFASGANGDQAVNIAENSNNLVTVRAVATDIATDDSASFELKFHVKRKGGVTTIMGTPTPTKIYNDTNAATWNIAANVSSTLAMFRISCAGEASKTINWSMSIEIVEVSRV